MKGFKNYVFFALSLAVLALLLLPATSLTAPPRPSTHLGVPAGELVTLRTDSLGSRWVFKEVPPDGSLPETEYVVPADKWFIVTDIETYRLSPTIRVLLLNSPSDSVDARTVTILSDGRTEHLSAGIVIPPGGKLGLSPYSTTDILAPFFVFIRGYLVPAP